MRRKAKTKVFTVGKKDPSLKGSLKELGIDFLEGLKKGLILGKGGRMRVYRGDVGIIIRSTRNPEGRLVVSYLKEGRRRLRGPGTAPFTTDIHIAKRFARDKADYANIAWAPETKQYVPVLITAEVDRWDEGFDLEKEVYPIGIIDIKSIKSLGLDEFESTYFGDEIE